MQIIVFKNVSKIYPPNTAALADINLEINAKEFVSVVGKSGAGKTTLMRLLLCEEKPTSGKIFFDGNFLEKYDIPSLRRRIGVVFQDYKLLPTKTAYENIAYALEVIGAYDEEIKRDVPQVLEVVGLLDKANNFPNQLSGGEKQRIALARALIHRPDAILADEPTGDLDPYNKIEVVKVLKRINDLGTTVILATHDKEIINTLGKRVVTLEEGRIIRDEEKGRFIL